MSVLPLYSWPSAAAFEGRPQGCRIWPGPLGLTLCLLVSTGEPKAIIKRQQQLEAEVVELYRLWQLQGCVVHPTVALPSLSTACCSRQQPCVPRFP